MPIEKMSLPTDDPPQSSPVSGAVPHATPAAAFEPLALAEVEKRHILATLEYCKGNRTHAAKMLQVSIRTLRNKLHAYNHSPHGNGDSGSPEITGGQS